MTNQNEAAVSEIKKILNLQDFNKSLATFVSKSQALIDESGGRSSTVLEFENGKRYVKVWSGSQGNRSVWCFIDKTNGDVLKAASWKAPAKHARGNIYDPDNGMKNITIYGPAYLR